MSEVATHPREPQTVDVPGPPMRVRRVAGGLLLAHVVLFVAAAALSGPPTIHEGQAGIEHSFNDGDLGALLAAGYLLTLGFLALVPVVVLLGRELGRAGELGRWAATTAAAAGGAYVLVIVGVALPAGGAALWAHHRGVDLPTVLAVNNIRNFAYFISLPVAGLFALGTGVAALVDGLMRTWVGWGGVVVGVALVLAIPAAAVGIQYGMPLLLLWLLGLAISLLRRTPGGPIVAATPTAQR